MSVGRVVEDSMVDKVVGTMVDNMVEGSEASVIDNLGFVEEAFVAQHWPHMGSSGTPVEIHHGPPCQPLEYSSSDIHFQISYCHYTNHLMSHSLKHLMNPLRNFLTTHFQ
jgi:hypothetical protein